MTRNALRWSLLASLALGACVADLDLGDPADGTETVDASTSGGEEPTDTDSATALSEMTDGPGGPTEPASGSSGGADPIDVDEAGFEFAQARCAALDACDCLLPNPEWVQDPQACEEDNLDAWEFRTAEAVNLGLQFNAPCYAQFFEALTDLSCDTAPPLSHFDLFEAMSCSMWVGAGKVGDACNEASGLLFSDSTCAAGLECSDGTCAMLPALGEPCLAGDGGKVCASDGVCDAGLCVARPLQGEPCANGYFCAEGSHCNDEGTCEATSSAGEPCEFGFECASMVCFEGTCSQPQAAVCGPYVFVTEE